MHNFTICEAEQRSAAWFAARLGRVTGSVASHLTATNKDGSEPAKRRDLRTKLALERITGQSLEDDYQNADMKRGIELEPDARAAYEALTGEIVKQTGFLSHTSLMVGCSLDGHLGPFEGIWECKCPRPANHLKYYEGGIVPAEHRLQLVHNLFVSGAQFAEFCSFCPEMPEPIRLFRVTYRRDDTELKAYELLLRTFLIEIEKEAARIQRLAAA